ncbi:GTF2E1 [Cordylochernes scorpioides]|uniref:GTF2E1 n=1 Tax=Cordylochernes scorpioides TaxID=51811 RepID=A0ABY6JX63_9ARAC|nr:GTF2E1 [Cordylochernes scorpioides]
MESTVSEVVCTEVPTALKRLVRLIMRAFYSQEQATLVDYLIRYPCIKEDDLVELLKLDRKQLRSAMALLKDDHFVKIRQRMETGPDGKANRQTYYYIHYKVFISVVLYKLDHIRRKFENDERDSTSRASFKCTKCSNTYTDLEIDRLLNFTTGELHCTFCGSAVEEDEGALPKQDSRLLLAKFNEQMELFYSLLNEIGDIKFSQSILEPEPTEIPHLRSSQGENKDAQGGSGPNRKKGKELWADPSRNAYNMPTDITVNFGSELPSDQQQAREQPIWMTQSTVIQSSAPTVSSEESALMAAAAAAQAPLPSHKHHDILDDLLAHERKNAKAPYVPGQTSGDESDTSESDNEVPEVKPSKSFAPSLSTGNHSPYWVTSRLACRIYRKSGKVAVRPIFSANTITQWSVCALSHLNRVCVFIHTLRKWFPL